MAFVESQPQCEPVLRGKQGSPDARDTLHPHRQPAPSHRCCRKGGPKGASYQYISLSAPDVPFNTCPAINKEFLQALLLYTVLIKLSQQRLLQGQCRKKRLQEEGVGCMGQGQPVSIQTVCLPVTPQPLHSPLSTDSGSSRPPAHTSTLIPSAHSSLPSRFVSWGPPGSTAFWTEIRVLQASCLHRCPLHCTPCSLPTPPNSGGLLPLEVNLVTADQINQ